MNNTRFGIYGGQYIPETLMNEITNLEKQYEYYKNNMLYIQGIKNHTKFP